MDIIELVISDEDEFNGIEAISIVTHPAIEADGVYLSKDGKKVQFAVETEEKGIFIAPILKPNKLVYRERVDGQGYYVRFAKDTIRTCAERYLMESRQWDMTEQHEELMQDVCLVESWIVEDPEKDKAAIYNLDVNEGTWMGVFRINNEDVKEKLKSGELKAISIEGYFSEKSELSMVEKEVERAILAVLKDSL